MTRTELIKKANAISTSLYGIPNQLYTCKATYYICEKYVILRSYQTVVAIFHKASATVYCFNYYSKTTVQHINKFAKLMNADRITYLYRRSDRVVEKALNRFTNTFKLTKSQFDNLEKFDYSCYICNKW